jgi:predicted AlkP superfamily phosphohydrolase/phosphomutase
MLAIGFDTVPESIVDVTPTVLRHFGVEPPPYARVLSRAA